MFKEVEEFKEVTRFLRALRRLGEVGRAGRTVLWDRVRVMSSKKAKGAKKSLFSLCDEGQGKDEM